MPLCISPAGCSLISTHPSPCPHHVYALILIGLLLLPTTHHCLSMSRVHPPPCHPSVYVLLLACSLQPRCIHQLRQIYWLGHIRRPRHALTDKDTFTPPDRDNQRPSPRGPGLVLWMQPVPFHLLGDWADWDSQHLKLGGGVLHSSNSGWIWVIIGTQLDTIWGESGLE